MTENVHYNLGLGVQTMIPSRPRRSHDSSTTYLRGAEILPEQIQSSHVNVSCDLSIKHIPVLQNQKQYQKAWYRRRHRPVRHRDRVP